MHNPLIHVPKRSLCLESFHFFSNHKVHHQTTKVYQISDKRDQVEELSKISGRTTAVMVKQVTYSVQESVNSKVL